MRQHHDPLTIGDGFRLGVGFLLAQAIVAVLVGAGLAVLGLAFR